MIPPRRAFEDARDRIADRIGRTPMMRLVPGEIAPGAPGIGRTIAAQPVLDARLGADLLLKLECLQITGSFKTRGALNKVLSLETRPQGIVTASGGNHGLAVAYAGRAASIETTVYLPSRTPEPKALRIARWGAHVVRAGDVWDDAHRAATEHASREGLVYVHPFADEDVVLGQGTIALEIFEDVPDVDLIIVAIGGGGLVSGVAAAAKQIAPHARIVGVEPIGAPTLFESTRAGEVIELAQIQTAAGTLAPRKSDAYNLAIIQECVDEIVLVSDDDMRDAARFLLAEIGIGAELSGAAALAAVLSGKIDIQSAKRPCVLVCGAGDDAMRSTLA